MYTITTTKVEDADAVARCVAAIARERRFLATTEGFSVEETRTYIDELKRTGGVHLVAVDGGEIVGWCDIARERFQAAAHVGHLGIGLLPKYRGRGLGRKLLENALDEAFPDRFERVELEVFGSNRIATALYRTIGFREEGRKRNGCKIDGRYDDVLILALLREDWAP
jgi:RimJ/RimL family protein N-acetyltransferase